MSPPKKAIVIATFLMICTQVWLSIGVAYQQGVVAGRKLVQPLPISFMSPDEVWLLKVKFAANGALEEKKWELLMNETVIPQRKDETR